jgi:hypothetical protein
MNQSEVEAFAAGLPNVQRSENYGYIFFFVGADHRLPFVSLLDQDYDYDRVSNLNRAGVYRVNIGLSRASYDALLGDTDPAAVDQTALNVFLPHPDYAKQNFVCILSPAGANAEKMKGLITEAHALAAERAAHYHPPSQ